MSGESRDLFEARDISTTGIGIFVPYRLQDRDRDLESVVDLVIHAAERRALHGKGRVIHSSKTDREFFGVVFVKLSPAKTRQISRYVDRLTGDAGGEDGK